MALQGWTKLHRGIVDWRWYKHGPTRTLFIHLLLVANHEDRDWMGIKILRGQRVTGRRSLAEETGLSEQNIRTAIKNLKSTNEITIKPYQKYSIITVTNYDEYQSTNHVANQRPTSNQPTSNQQVTTNKNEKNDKNENKILKQNAPGNSVLKIGKTKKSEAEREKARQIKLAYVDAYKSRYQIEPVFSVKEHRLTYQLLTQVGFDEAVSLAQAYVNYNDPWHVGQKHPFALLVGQLSKIRIELRNPARMLDGHIAREELKNASRQVQSTSATQELERLVEEEKRRLGE